MLPNVEAHHREPAVEGQELRVRRSKQNEASQGAKEKTAAMVDTLLKDWKQYMNSGGVLQRRSTPCWLTIVLSEVPVTPYCVRNDLSFVQRWCIQLINDKCNCLT